MELSGTGSRVSRKRALLVKGIKEANITPSQFNIFVGQNNHGKTNLFEALDRKKVAVPFTPLYPLPRKLPYLWGHTTGPEWIKVTSCVPVIRHVCPVYFVTEPFTETKNRRKHSRSIPRDVMLKVVRRDGQICQECHKPVPDNQVEFDHIIPFSKGGRSTIENIRLIHKKCNRKKGSSLNKILLENPIEHLWELRKQSKKKRIKK